MEENNQWKLQPPYTQSDNNKPFVAKYKASCYCGTVQYEASEDPVDGTYCHCRNCQVLHGAPFQWAVIFHKDHIRFTKGVDDLVFYDSSSRRSEHILPCKVSCGKCRSPIADEGRRMFLAFPTLFQDLPKIKDSLKTTSHIFYGQRCVDVKDGLPKYAGHKEKSEKLPE
eukprot:TRINITY_DN2427_c0_g1_i1.p1 TRINITY_DN2427_c0_g1~~TRINITY_DN2427_c0_g1_i1.p1  ORF type:complete len:169 (-),score=26.47 TRINITY_DN2427_c0_g1_i1:29-535(-)